MRRRILRVGSVPRIAWGMQLASAMTHPFLSQLKPVLNIAHRGGAGLFPENTWLAFERSLTQFKCDMLELDVRCSSDGEVVVFHDETLDRTTNGFGAVSSHSWGALHELNAAFHFHQGHFKDQNIGLLRFESLIERLQTTLMNVEIKDAHTIEPFVQLLKKFPKATQYLCLGSQLDSVANVLREKIPDACFFYPENALAECIITAKTQGTFVQEDRYQVLDMPMFWEESLVFDSAFSKLARENKKWVNVWTVDTEAHMKRAIEDEVGGIMTDRPDVLQRVLQTR
jgi:glycerophosphoryl diester phosphodiesterase